MRGFISAFTKRYRATIFLLIIATISGYFAYQSIPREKNPDIKIPIIYVSMSYFGISPTDGERLLLRPMELELRSIKGIKKIKSFARENISTVKLEFEAGMDTNKALRDVRDKVNDNKYKLPQDIDSIVIQEVDMSLEAVLNVILSGDVPNATLIQIGRELKDIVESVDGVLEVELAGDLEDSIEIILDPIVLNEYGIPINILESITKKNNQIIPAGTMKNAGGHYSVKMENSINNAKELLEFPVKTDGSSVLTLADIATVKRTYKEPEVIARVNGNPSVVLDVRKKSGANILNTTTDVKLAVEQAAKFFPQNIEISYSGDQSNQIKDMVAELENGLILAAFLVICIIVYTMGWRSAMLVALSLPTSFLVGILILQISGLTLNMVVLFSLILSVGMIVDDAIVVNEYADQRLEEGVSENVAFIDAATRMFWPIVTSTLVKIVVFMPLLFWPGMIGEFMKFMPITMITILTNSLLFALLFQPSLGEVMERIFKRKIQHKKEEKSGKFIQKYTKLLAKCLERPKIFLSSMMALMVLIYVFFGFGGTGFEFFPSIEPESATIVIGSSGNLSIEQKDDIMKKIEARIFPLKNEIDIFYAKMGNVNQEDRMAPDTIALMQIEFTDWKKRRKAKTIFAELEERINDIDGIKFEILQKMQGPTSQKPIEFSFAGVDYPLLVKFTQKFIEASKSIGGFKNLEDSRSAEAIELNIKIDRKLAAKYNVDPVVAGHLVMMMTTGYKVSSYRPIDTKDEVDILLRIPKEERKISRIQDLIVINSEGLSIPVSSFMDIKMQKESGRIKKINGKTVITIKSDIEEGVLADTKVKEIKDWLAENLEPGVSVIYGGDDEDQKESASFLGYAFMIALLMMSLIMLIQFNNIYHTFVVMSAVFISTVGVLLGLIIMWEPFGVVMCGIGVIALAGVVLNNNIIFVDTYQSFIAQGMDVKEALIQTGAQRIRPILLTAISAVLGLMPMVMGVTINFFELEISYGAPSSQWWKQLATSIAGGLSFATILTLFFTP
ncbi:MAG: efflux RND transporter permease subunit, partial [Proteobacteria bacterium]|nr:efflux RND transporter permease subunit [Pseudomonadota bacterium]